MHWELETMLAEMESLKPVVLNNLRILEPHNPKDHYYREIRELADRDYFFETYLVIVWAGMKLKPRRIMEIGTRNGGSLIQLLSMLIRYDHLEIVCFDNWQEIGGPRAVRRNLKRMNIPADRIEFVSGDSGKTVPAYQAKHPGAEFDYILVDGGHTPEMAAADLEHAGGLVARGGILIFDDIGPEGYRLIDVWRNFQKSQGDKFHWFEKQWRKGVAWAVRR